MHHARLKKVARGTRSSFGAYFLARLALLEALPRASASESAYEAEEAARDCCVSCGGGGHGGDLSQRISRSTIPSPQPPNLSTALRGRPPGLAAAMAHALFQMRRKLGGLLADAAAGAGKGRHRHLARLRSQVGKS